MDNYYKRREKQMNETERQEFMKNETRAIYEEFNNYISQMILLKPFLKNLADVASGENPNYDLYEIVKRAKV